MIGQKQKPNKYLLFVIAFIFLLILPLCTKSQVDLPGGDILLKEYLFPISSYAQIGSPSVKNAIDCLQYKGYANFLDCPLPGFDEVANIKSWFDNLAVLTTQRAEFSYDFTIEAQDNYVFMANISNQDDNFFNLSREHFKYKDR